MTWKMIYDILRKGPVLKEVIGEVAEMNKRLKKMFAESFTALASNKDEWSKEILGKDEIINRYVKEVRRKILTYLAANSAPDINAALVLTSIIIDYERVGDYCKNIAQLNLLFPSHLGKDIYFENIQKIKENILEMFDKTLIAFDKEDIEKAKYVLELHKENKGIHAEIVEKLNKDKKIKTNKAITYAILSIYLRRISAHLENISTSVVQSFPKLGFSKK